MLEILVLGGNRGASDVLAARLMTMFLGDLAAAIVKNTEPAAQDKSPYPGMPLDQLLLLQLLV
jgi:hypothetical protein